MGRGCKDTDLERSVVSENEKRQGVILVTREVGESFMKRGRRFHD